jgi:Rieske Fe-S protein
MNRKNFIKKCSFACISGAAFAAVMQSCTTTKMTNGNISGDDLIVPISDFETKAGNEKHFKKYVVIQNDILKYPICVYRHTATEYSALWMQCTHQGAELQVFGNKLQCPAHGSEFDNKGKVQNGPADNKLKTFPITIEQNYLKISLKAI